MSSSRIDLFVGKPGDLGSSAWCTNTMEAALDKVIDKRFHQIRRVQLLTTSCFSELGSVKAVVVPGGNAACMYSDIADQIPQIPTLFDRVAFYGSCAGAILACNLMAQQLAPELKQSENSYSPFNSRYLGGYPGNTLAPLYSTSSSPVFSEKKMQLREINTNIGCWLKTIQSLHIKGPGFVDASVIGGVEILATYNDRNSYKIVSRPSPTDPWTTHREYTNEVIAESIFYKQRYRTPGMVLVGSHPEVTSEDILSKTTGDIFKITLKEQQELAGLMKDGDKDREILFKQHLQKLGIATMPI